MNNIININPKGELHDYQERYWTDNKIYYRGIRKNNKRIAYNEFHSSKHTIYYIR